MSDSMFLSIIKEKPQNYVDLEERYKYQYPIILKYLENKIKGWNIGDFFDQYKKENIAVYAMTEFADLVLDDWTNFKGNCHIKCLGDQNHEKYKNRYKGYDVASVEELVNKYDEGDIEMILVCSIFHENEVFEDFLKKGMPLDALISINSVVFMDRIAYE